MTKPHRISLLLAILFVLGWTLFALSRQYKARHEPDADFSDIKARGELRVCGEYDPFSFYTDENGQRGFHYELAHAFAEAHNLRLIYLYEGSFQTRLQWLTSGRCDLLTGPMPVLESLEGSLLYTEPIYTSRLVLVQHASGKPLRNQVELAGKVLLMPSHSPHLVRINHLAVEISDSIHVKELRVFTNEELLRQVAEGKAEYVAMDEYVAKAWASSYPNLDVHTPLSLSQFQAWAVRPNSPALRDSLDAFLSEYKKSRAFTRLMKTYGVQ